MPTVPAVRRSPVFSRFIVTGAVVGAVLALLAAALTRGAKDYGWLAPYGYFALGGAFLGGLVGGVVAVVVDGRSARGR